MMFVNFDTFLHDVGTPGGHFGAPGDHVGAPGCNSGAPGGHFGAPGGHGELLEAILRVQRVKTLFLLVFSIKKLRF